jgi:DNA-directed RNA polymerase sigma subunit (sigma70/sigma32)
MPADVDTLAAELEMSAEELRAFMDRTKDSISYDIPVGDDATLGEFQSALGADPFDHAVAGVLSAQVEDALGSLTTHEHFALVRRMGVHDGTEWKLKDIAAELDCSSSRAGQLIRQAQDRLRQRFPELAYLAGLAAA